MPLFAPALCECGEHIDPLGLHFASCIKVNARTLLHNALRDCFYGSLHHILRDLPSHQVALLISDKMSKSSTYIHHWYPLKQTAPAIHERQAPYGYRPTLIAPSKSPDILVAFFSAPHRPVFGDFVFSSPRLSDKTCHSQAAQVACNSKHADYSGPQNIMTIQVMFSFPSLLNALDICTPRLLASLKLFWRNAPVPLCNQAPNLVSFTLLDTQSLT